MANTIERLNLRTGLALSFLATGLIAAALPALAQDQGARYLENNASYCEMFRGLSKAIPAECATQDELAAQPEVRTRGLRKRAIVLRKDDALSSDTSTIVDTGVINDGLAAGSLPATSVASAADTGASSDSRDDLRIALQVQFEFDSAALTSDAKRVLDKVAAVLNDDIMSANTIEIVGHTDAIGPDAYNLSLSQARALAVRSYLTSVHGVAAERIPARGVGERALYDASNPDAAINRRVEFGNLSG